MNSKTNWSSLLTLMSVFFFWGFVAASNTILIPIFKSHFTLMQWQSQMVDFAFYAAYFVGSLIYFLISFTAGDPLGKIGYKKGLIIGLLISSVGAIGFVPAAGAQSFTLMLTSLFVVALGFALQQIVANPYVIAIGNPATGSHRVNMAGGINSFGTMIGPLLLSLAIFGTFSGSNTSYIQTGNTKSFVSLIIERTPAKSEKISMLLLTPESSNFEESFVTISEKDFPKIIDVYSRQVKHDKAGLIIAMENDSLSKKSVDTLKATFPKEHTPIVRVEKSYVPSFLKNALTGSSLYVEFVGIDGVGFPYIILCIAFLLFALLLGVSKLPPITNREHVEHSMGAFKYPQLVLGMIAIFVYVGVEVTIQSNLPELMKQSQMLGLDSSKTVHFISLYWGSLMIGRWTGAITVFNLSKMKRKILTAVVPLVAYCVILAVNYLKLSAANDLKKMNDLYSYFPFVLILIAGFFMAQEKPARTMTLFGTMAGIMMLIGLMTTGKVALYSFMSGGLFCSVMWPCIFSLSIAGLGKFTNQGSSMLIMMILGGALIPPLQGYVADIANIHISYLIPVFCFAYLAFYGWKVKRVLQSQGIDYDATVNEEKVD